MRDALEATANFPGIGGVFNLSPEDHVGLHPADIVMVRIVNGDWDFFPPEEW